MKSFGNIIQEARLKKDLSLRELSEIAGLDFSYISRIEKGYNPSKEAVKKLAKALNLSVNELISIAGYAPKIDLLNALEDEFSEINAAGKPLTPQQRLAIIRAIDSPNNTTNKDQIPILGTIRAGIPILAKENWGDMLEIPSDITASFALEVKGDSMIGAGIHEGDYAICRETDQANSGSIVVALKDIDPEISEATLKYYFSENGRGILRAANPEYEDIVISEKHRITGVMVSLLRKRPTPVSYYKDYISIKDYKLTPWNDVIEKAISYGIKPDKVKSIIEMHWEMINKQ